MTQKIQWPEPMLEALRSMRQQGKPLLSCSEEIGVSYPVVVRKARELGLSGRRNSGRVAGRVVMAQTAHTGGD